MLNRLSTKARQHKRNSSISPSCSFCAAEETRDHLFFECSFSSQIWKRFASDLQLPLTYSWDMLIQWGSLLKRKSLRNLISKLTWQACIYHIWLERNARIHVNNSSSFEALCEKIRLDIRFKLMSLPPDAVHSIDPAPASSLGLRV